MTLLHVQDLRAGAAGLEILSGVSLSVAAGETHAVMGPNGSGKSTVANVLAGHPGYAVTGGSAAFDGADLLAMDPEQRAQAGLFLAFQYPAALPGVPVARFLHLSLNSIEKARGEAPTGFAAFLRPLKDRMRRLRIPWGFAERDVNDGFSGGEKKRLEMLQMLVLQPRLAILDEIDSGLDVDALRFVGEAVQALRTARPETALIVITHYQRILRHITPDRVHVLRQGRITESGGSDLAERIEETGYQELRV